MSVIFVLIIVSIIIALFFLALFIWAVKTGQFKDNYGPAVRVLFDDHKPSEENK